ncbi:glycerophosphodiester phosphodiesterase family protein [Spirosoma sp. KUDC1026]|uniref:glycerophosphodiester phosphodiesterase family protein n=1 Tax=Spirosoma sp. KUDC1026 TaxID=2745947 RepID=UPI00159B9C8A|nr:glycerophosphodiester phosphodiesterase family protein [Spirosoma sp. KUDC1026]QKZ12551.1 glycerophosphodiester phosphodiesterase family protein [Spirosoma sp. KUDC1026]
MKHLFLLTLLLTATLASTAQSKRYATATALEQTLGYQPARAKPLLLAHRGGPASDETENSLETFRHMYQQVPEAIIEMDVRMTADSVLVLLHDDDIARTTTGQGSLKSMTWAELKQLQLRDLEGKPTNQRMPMFDDVLKWGAGKVVMAIDAKPGTDLTKMMKLIDRSGALNSVFIICYSVADARQLRETYPDLWVALGFERPEQIETVAQSIKLHHLIALASRQEADFYRQFHDKGIVCTVGTYGPKNLDEQPMTSVADEYRSYVKTGADILTTDRPAAVNSLFK